jgi:hypothetical protein
LRAIAIDCVYCRELLTLEYEFLHQIGVVDPHYEEWGCRRLALFDVDKKGPVKFEMS